MIKWGGMNFEEKVMQDLLTGNWKRNAMIMIPETDDELRNRVRSRHVQQVSAMRFNVENEKGHGLEAVAEYYGLKREERLWKEEQSASHPKDQIEPMTEVERQILFNQSAIMAALIKEIDGGLHGVAEEEAHVLLKAYADTGRILRADRRSDPPGKHAGDHEKREPGAS